MSYKSLVTLNLNVKENAGWCLSFARQVFGAPAGFAHATASWNAAKFRHETRSLPNVAVPLYFRWVNKIVGDPNFGVNQGHVVVFVPGRGFLSSPGKGFGQQWFDSIVAVENYFGCTFVGWTEDINGKRVAEYVADSQPAPVAPPVVTGNGGDYYLDVEVNGYADSRSAAERVNANSRVPAGSYKVFNEANGVVNITRDASKPGWWINPADDVAPAPAPQPAPEAPQVPSYTVKAGDTLGQIILDQGWSTPAGLWGDGGDVNRIAAANGIANPSAISIGQVIRKA